MLILIAEDDAACRLILRKSLEKLGHECVQTEDGYQAWELFLEMSPQVVISDWMMPGIDGLEFCRRVREHNANDYTYFIILTALTDKASSIAGLEAGADDYLVKPLDRAELQARLIAASRVTSLHKLLIEQKLELERLNSELFEDGRRDPLTRIGNRLRMTEDLEALGARAVRYGHSFCIGLCDIDYFKRYNDTCGHAAGDETLRVVARTLANHGRSGDMAYRYGGEEFLVVLPEQSIETAVTAMERRRKAVESLGIPHPGRDPAGIVSISAGVAMFDPKAKSPVEDCMERADQALYFAKENGRNRVASYEVLEDLEAMNDEEESVSSPPVVD